MLKFIILLFSINQFVSSQFIGLQNDSYFFSYPLKTNWFKAYKICVNNGQDLVSVDSVEKVKEINNHIASLHLNNKFNEWPEQLWTSGTDNGFEGKFYWMTNGKDVPNSLWNSGEPNGGTNENCVALWNSDKDGYSFKTNDAPCTTDLYFLCEKRPILFNCPEANIDIRGSIV